MPPLTDLAARAGSLAKSVTEATRSLAEASNDLLVQPTVRLGVTGLARSGKTVFTTALVHQLTGLHPLPALRASQEGRLRRARLVPQPDDAVTRFPYEDHLAALTETRHWPRSTDRISQLRLEIDYERKSGWRTGPASLMVDIVDYPGEWLLDLALIEQTFEGWSRETIAAAERPGRTAMAAPWLASLRALDPNQPLDEIVAERASEAFKLYLAAVRAGPEAVATTPPGRFLMPGDLAGSPALTFAPLILTGPVNPDSLGGLMQRRFEAYKHRVVTPFFRDHFQRIDRQIVLVDVLAAVDAGAAALAELEEALDRVLMSLRVGRNSLLSRFFAPRADRILFAATKADHLHHTSHDRLDALLRLLVARSLRRTEAAGAHVSTQALASVRSTRETVVHDGPHAYRAVAGTPEAGESIDGETFDGETEAAIFPGELPERPEAVLEGAVPPGSLRFPRFRPPQVSRDALGRPGCLPQIRLDRALNFLIGDRLA